jgi:hypothetical protein
MVISADLKADLSLHKVAWSALFFQICDEFIKTASVFT